MSISFNKKSLGGCALLLGMAIASQASATVYSFEIDNPPGSTSAGDVTSFATSFDSVTEQLSFSSTVTEAGGYLANGFWMVLSDGPNPKGDYNEYAIFYGDGLTGNLTSYVYNGANSSNSWNTPGEFIQSFSGGLTTDTSVPGDVTFSFSIDTSFINAYTPTTPGTNEWTGAAFGDHIGIWYHPAVFGGQGPTYNQDGSLASFPIQRAGWYDTNYTDTHVDAPAPTVALLLMGGLLTMVGFKRRSNKIV